jgi:hypothetical protein
VGGTIVNGWYSSHQLLRDVESRGLAARELHHNVVADLYVYWSVEWHDVYVLRRRDERGRYFCGGNDYAGFSGRIDGYEPDAKWIVWTNAGHYSLWRGKFSG